MSAPISAKATPHHSSKPESSAQWLVGGGEMGAYIRSKDWSATPLGPIEQWPQSLRTTVSLCLASNFPISIAWGPHRTQIYNDGYWPICGAKHPTSMGQDFAECWASPWPVIGEAFERACAGETSFLENQRMFLDRHGYLEETFFTFSFSPIRDETNAIGGLFHPVTETTANMLNARRTRALRDLGDQAALASTSDEALTMVARTIGAHELDVPFALFYKVSDDGRQAQLVAATGVSPEWQISSGVVRLTSETLAAFMAVDVESSRRNRVIDDLLPFIGTGPCGPYPEQPTRAVLMPVMPAGSDRPVAFVLAGLSSRLPVNDAYLAFFDLLGSGITTAVVNARAYEEERQRAERLAEIDRAKTAFFSNVSHEFRTPLTLMLGPLEEELAEPALAAASRARLDTAHRNSLRLLKLVNALLDFSRIEAGRMQASYEPTDLAAFTSDLASVFRSAIERAGLIFTVECPPIAEPTYVDRTMWEKVVFNLLSNALKHTFAGEIVVSLHSSHDALTLRVADTGIGIPSTELPRLFDRFHRVQGARSRSHEGTGIGLALVQELVALHGGKVTVASEEGKGTSFIVRIPLGSTHLPSDQIRTERPLASTADRADAYLQEVMSWLPEAASASTDDAALDRRGSPAATSNTRCHVLLVDDNADLRGYVARLLRPAYEVEIVSDGLAALAAVRARVPDLVLSDVMMPGLDGFGLLKALRADAATHTIPVILLSARAGEEASIEGLQAGADDYLVKPFSARELLARVRTHLEMARARRQWARELEDANRELEAFSYSVSHDLRTPLRAIDGFTALVQQRYGHTMDETAQGHMQRVRHAATRMGQLIDDLLGLSRVSRAAVHREQVDVTALCEQVLGDLSATQGDRRVDIRIARGLSADADPRLLAIVLENLLGNAWKFTARTNDARIEVGVGADRPECFYVRDNGAGFDMAHAAKLFAPFQRLHRASEFDGTGIGLATAHRAVARHGGEIWAESAVGAGATFYFTLSGAQ